VRIGEEGSAAVTFEVVPGTYALVIEYDPLPESTQNVQLALRIDGAAPSRGAENIVLRRRWRDKPGAQREDGRGNDIRLPQEEILFAERGWLTATAADSTGYEKRAAAVLRSAVPLRRVGVTLRSTTTYGSGRRPTTADAVVGFGWSRRSATADPPYLRRYGTVR